MKDASEKNRQAGSQPSQQPSQQPRNPLSPMQDREGNQPSGTGMGGSQNRQQPDGSNNDSAEYPNPRRVGETQVHPSGSYGDPSAQGMNTGDKDKDKRIPEQEPNSPGYSPFNPQGESPGETGSTSDRSGANRGGQHSEGRPSGGADRTGEHSDTSRMANDPSRSGQTSGGRDSTGGSVGGSSSTGSQQGTQKPGSMGSSSSTSGKGGPEQKRDDDRNSRK